MKYLLDTANLEAIRFCNDIFPISGVSTNPSIVKASFAKSEKKPDFFAHMNAIRAVIGPESPFHIQVTAPDSDGMLRDADAILNRVDEQVCVKIPVTMEGLKAIRALKKQDITVTATAVYGKTQAFLALEAGADYIAPYYNRMENMGLDSDGVIAAIAQMISEYDYPTQILAASFKNAGQVERAFEAGAQCATMDPSILLAALKQPYILDAVETFQSDWKAIFGDVTAAELS
ncbi:MAG: fructose-6-phosphate aldolase [Lachnospiraceae bacterium]|nr:fructose-6-phosphate aldolase [Lachnospiraceae bacterium]